MYCVVYLHSISILHIWSLPSKQGWYEASLGMTHEGIEQRFINCEAEAQPAQHADKTIMFSSLENKKDN